MAQSRGQKRASKPSVPNAMNTEQRRVEGIQLWIELVLIYFLQREPVLGS
jgi:hypothetical protein